MDRADYNDALDEMVERIQAMADRLEEKGDMERHSVLMATIEELLMRECDTMRELQGTLEVIQNQVGR